MQSKVRFEIVSGLYCDFLNCLVENGFYISSVENTAFGIKAVCLAADYGTVARMAKKFQCRTKILGRKGIYFKIRKILKRRGLVLGAVLVFVYLFVFSHMIWRIDVISPSENITQDVYSMLYAGDIYAGSLFSQQKNSRMIQHIFMEVENVGYVTMNFSKGILTCKIDPAINRLPYLQHSTSGNIVATESGVIEDLRVYKGFSQVQAGQSVYKGDVLVSATYIDRNGTLQQVMPRAYIKAACRREYTAQIDFEKDVWIRTGQTQQQTVVKFMGKSVEIIQPDTENWQRYDTEKTFESASFMGFCLPFTIEKTRFYNKELMHITRDQATAYAAGVKAVEAMIKADNALIDISEKCFSYTADADGATVSCTVYGHYDITRY
ncbi:MAG: sporulation protein YqfD [Oscillospiraceae bacterium]|nr:sporulation protein YqfD [Oscillospiraceae bacterium]